MIFRLEKGLPLKNEGLKTGIESGTILNSCVLCEVFLRMSQKILKLVMSEIGHNLNMY